MEYFHNLRTLKHPPQQVVAKAQSHEFHSVKKREVWLLAQDSITADEHSDFNIYIVHPFEFPTFPAESPTVRTKKTSFILYRHHVMMHHLMNQDLLKKFFRPNSRLRDVLGVSCNPNTITRIKS
jgi:hypothetical protein